MTTFLSVVPSLGIRVTDLLRIKLNVSMKTRVSNASGKVNLPFTFTFHSKSER